MTEKRGRQGAESISEIGEAVDPGARSMPIQDVVPDAMERFGHRVRSVDRTPGILIDNQCNILWHSPNAETLLQPPMPLWIGDDRVHAAGGAGARAWASFVERVGEDGERVFLTGETPGTWVLVRGWSDRFGEHRLIFLKCTPAWPCQDVTSSGLTRDFGLTRSESSVLDAFARLLKPDQIAEKLGISVSTVRSHLKQIHTKMSVNSGVHLLRITRAYTDT